MERRTTTIQINIPLFGAPTPGGQFAHALQVTELVADDGQVMSSQHNNLPLVAGDFNDALIATINARLVDVGLSLVRNA